MSVNITITEGEIRNAVAIALSEAFGPEKKDALIRQVIRAHLEMKDPSSGWGRDQTILDKAVGDMIRAEALEQLKARLGEMKPRVAEIVRKHLGPKWEEATLKQFDDCMMGQLRITGFTLGAAIERDT